MGRRLLPLLPLLLLLPPLCACGHNTWRAVRRCRPQAERVLEAAYTSWTFDSFKLAEVTDGHPLSALAWFLFARSGLISTFGIQPLKLARALHRLEAGYSRNP